MVLSGDGRRLARRAGAAVLLLATIVASGMVQAVELPRPDEALDLLAPGRLAAVHPGWTAVHRKEAAIVDGLLVWPSIGIGGIIDSNPLHAHRPVRGAGGVALAPDLLVEHETTLHRTDAYASGDLRFYPGQPSADAIEGRAGLLHDWLPQPDFAVRSQAEVDRHTDLFDTAGGSGSGHDEDRRHLIFETDVRGAVSLQKNVDRLLLALSGTVLRADVSHVSQSPFGAVGSSAETVLTGTARLGYLLPSFLAVFGEAGTNRAALDAPVAPSTGSRFVAGIGTAGPGLLHGEIFAGRADQTYAVMPRTVVEPVWGGRIAWDPDRIWTVAFDVQRSLGQVTVATRADGLGTPTTNDAATIAVTYALSPAWRAEARAGATWVDYLGTLRRDRLAFADLRLEYQLSRSIDLSGRLRVADLRSTLAAASYEQAMATLAASYHY